jgi:hypothetical protein
MPYNRLHDMHGTGLTCLPCARVLGQPQGQQRSLTESSG